MQIAGKLLRCVPRSMLRKLPKLGQPVVQCSATSNQAGSRQRQLLVAHILLRDTSKPELLDDLEQQVRGGADFGKLAQQRSECGSAKRKGQLGWLSRGTFYPEFEEAAFSADIGAITRASSPIGLHLIHVLDMREEMVVQQMTVQELFTLLEGPVDTQEVQFVDVREPWEYETSRLPHFQLFPLSKFAEWKDTVSDTLDPSKETLVLCHHGVRSMQAASFLVSERGFSNVKNITGGIHEYSTGVDRSVPTY